MNDFNRTMGATRTMDMSTDAGLRSFMLGVYNKLAMGIALAGALAFAAGTYAPLTNIVFGTPLMYLVMFGPIALIIGSQFFMRNPSPTGSAILYWSIVTLMGLGLGVWVYAAQSGMAVTSRAGVGGTIGMLTIAKAFYITATAFGALSLYGYTTKRDLGPIGSFAIMAIWGVVLLSVVSFLFPPSAMLEYIIMAAVFVLSAAIVAWQTQELKEGYYALGGDARGMAVMTNWGALNFFISFVNMFQIILSLLSND